MLLALALTAQVAAAAPLHLVEADAPRFSARLLVQGPPPAPAPAPGADAASLQRRVDELNGRLRELKTDWPVGAIVLAHLGFSAAGALIPTGLVVALLGVVAAGAQGAGTLLAIGLGVLALGVVGLVAGIAGLVIGLNAQGEAKRTRDELIREREGLQQQLEALKAPPTSVERGFVPQSLVRVAVF